MTEEKVLLPKQLGVRCGCKPNNETPVERNLFHSRDYVLIDKSFY